MEYDLLGRNLFLKPFHVYSGHNLSSQVKGQQWSAGEVNCNTSTYFLFVLCVNTENYDSESTFLSSKNLIVYISDFLYLIMGPTGDLVIFLLEI